MSRAMIRATLCLALLICAGTCVAGTAGVVDDYANGSNPPHPQPSAGLDSCCQGSSGTKEFDEPTCRTNLLHTFDLAQQPFDLVLLDIMMPVMNGYEVLEQVKSDMALRNIPIIMMLNNFEKGTRISNAFKIMCQRQFERLDTSLKLGIISTLALQVKVSQ